MDKQKAKQDVKQKGKKILKTIITIVLIITLLFVVLFFFLGYMLNDKKRNPDNALSLDNEDVINLRMIKGLEEISDDKYIFKLSEVDVNTLLKNSLKEVEFSSYVESAYVEIDDEEVSWFFDLNQIPYTSRIHISTHLENFNYVIDKISAGSLNITSLVSNNFLLTNEMFDLLFQHASIPMVAHLEERRFEYNPSGFIEHFSLSEVTHEFFSLITPSIVPYQSQFGFEADLSSIKATLLDLSGDYDLVNDLKGKVTNSALTSVGSGKNILEVSGSNLAKWMKSCFDTTSVIERIGMLDCKLSQVQFSFENNKFHIDWVASIGNFFFKKSTILNFQTDGKANFAAIIDKPLGLDVLETYLINELFDNSTPLISPYLTHVAGSLRFDFSSVVAELNATTNAYAYNKELMISNNSFAFYLSPII